jgi:hypothetical protein
MEIISKLSLVGFTCVVIAAGTLAARANAGSIVSPRVETVSIALNPQPLPPYVDPEDEFFDHMG